MERPRAYLNSNNTRRQRQASRGVDNTTNALNSSKYSAVHSANSGITSSSYETKQEDYMKDNNDIKAIKNKNGVRSIKSYSKEESVQMEEEMFDRNSAFSPFSTNDSTIAAGVGHNMKRSNANTFMKSSKSDTNLSTYINNSNRIKRGNSNVSNKSMNSRRSNKPSIKNNKQSPSMQDNHQATREKNIYLGKEKEYDPYSNGIENPFHLGLEPMETDISSMTDTMYSLNSKYQKYLNKSKLKSKFFSFDEGRDKNMTGNNNADEHEAVNHRNSHNNNQQYDRSHYENQVNELFNDWDHEFQQQQQMKQQSLQSRSSYQQQHPSSQTRPNTINAPNEYDDHQEKTSNDDNCLGCGSFDNAVNTINNILNERKNTKTKHKGNPGFTDHYQGSNDESNIEVRTPKKSNSKLGEQEPSQLMNDDNLVNHPSAIRLIKQVSTDRSIAKDTYKKTEVSPDWAKVAVSAASLILMSESQQVAQAATAAVLSIGGLSNGNLPVNKSTALEAAAEASTAALSVGW